MSIQHNDSPCPAGRGPAARSTAAEGARTVSVTRPSVADRGHAQVAALAPSSFAGGGHARPDRAWVDPAVWERHDMRLALAFRDVRAVFVLLGRFGVSQRRIAARTEQSQGEISEILTGRRRVVSYGLLIRVADGLGVPRGWMGLAYDRDTAQLFGSEAAR